MQKIFYYLVILLFVILSSCKQNLRNSDSATEGRDVTDTLEKIIDDGAMTDSVILDKGTAELTDSQIIVKTSLIETNDSSEIVRTHESIPDVVGKIGRAYFINRSSNSIVDSVTVSRDMFQESLPWIDISEFEITAFEFCGYENNQYTFFIFICKPDSDHFYSFYYHYSDTGSSIELDESELEEDDE